MGTRARVSSSQLCSKSWGEGLLPPALPSRTAAVPNQNRVPVLFTCYPNTGPHPRQNSTVSAMRLCLYLAHIILYIIQVLHPMLKI
jgi:hypothetical protein